MEDVLKNKEVYFIDKNKSKHGKEILKGIFCYGIDKMYGCGNRAVTIITTSAFADDISMELNNQKYQTTDKLADIQIIDDFCTIFSRNKEVEFKLLTRDKILKLFEWFEDEESCNILYRDYNKFFRWRSFLNYDINDYLLKDENFMPLKLQNLLETDGSILCCGVFLENTIKEINKLTNGNYKKIYAFEINRIYMEQIKKVIDEKKITLINACLGKNDIHIDSSIRGYGAHNPYSYIDLCSDGFIDVKSLDTLIESGELPEKISFVKLGIENAEIAALEGMQNMIRNHKPLIAVSIFEEHYLLKQESLQEIAFFLNNLVPEYKFMMRSHYNRSASLDAKFVLYAFTDK